MPVYTWSGKTSTGRPVGGELKAKSLEEAMTSLQNRGIIVTEVKKKSRSFKIPLLSSIFGRVGLKDLTVFTRQFATMINAGIPIVQCLAILEEQTNKKRFQEILHRIKKNVEAGKTLAESMNAYRKVFGNLIISMVEVGETGGVLGATLTRISDYLEKVMNLRRKVKSSMAYPVIVLIFATALTLGLLIFLIPRFASLYESANMSLPTPTRIVMSVSFFLKRYIVLILIGLGFLFLAFRKYTKTSKGRKLYHGFLLKIPLIGSITRKSAISRFARTLGILVRSGVPILDGLQITARTTGNAIVEEAIMKARKSIGEGKTIAKPLRESGAFPPLVVHLVAVGEQTGRLSDMLDKIADFYEDEVDNAVGTLATVIEPVMLIVVGIMIGGILISMYLPIFNLASTLGK